jgi:hypothetical protein
MNPELEPLERFSESPKSVTDTPTFIYTQAKQQHIPEIAARYRWKHLATSNPITHITQEL